MDPQVPGVFANPEKRKMTNSGRIFFEVMVDKIGGVILPTMGPNSSAARPSGKFLFLECMLYLFDQCLLN